MKTHKFCRSCDEDKPVDRFYGNKGCVDGLRSFCKDCEASTRREQTKKYREEHPDYWTNGNGLAYRLKKYGLSVEQYNELRDGQGSKCKICGEITILCVDHDHETGAVRGLLCRACNLGLGNFKDDERLLALATQYLQNYRLV